MQFLLFDSYVKALKLDIQCDILNIHYITLNSCLFFKFTSQIYKLSSRKMMQNVTVKMPTMDCHSFACARDYCREVTKALECTQICAEKCQTFNIEYGDRMCSVLVQGGTRRLRGLNGENRGIFGGFIDF